MPYKDKKDFNKAWMRWYYRNKLTDTFKKRMIAKSKAKNRYKKREKCSIKNCNLMGERHHPDYEKPIEIIWLCSKHHHELHHKVHGYKVRSPLLSSRGQRKCDSMKKNIVFTLSLPPTTNAMYRFTGRGFMYKTKELKEWEIESGWKIKTSWKGQTLTKQIYLGMMFFLKRDRDIDNLKPIPDILESTGVIENDSQIIHMNIKKFEDKKNPRVEIEIQEL